MPRDLLSALDAWPTDSNLAKFFFTSDAAKHKFGQLRFPQKMSCTAVVKALLEQKDLPAVSESFVSRRRFVASCDPKEPLAGYAAKRFGGH